MDFGSIIGAVAPMIGNILGGGKKEAAAAPAAPAAAPAQQPSVFAQQGGQQATQGTVKMEIPCHLAGTVANVINTNS